MARSLAALVLAAFVLSISASAEEAITIRLSSIYAFAPASVRITARIEPHPDNRVVDFVIDCDNFFRASRFEPRLQITETYHNIPQGECVITATVVRVAPDGKQTPHSVSSPFSVRGPY